MTGALRAFTIGLTAFLTVVDLFATQAILPSLTRAYGVTPAAMGFAVNASTIGMAVGGLAVALFGRSIDRRRGILVSLALLSVPTALLATMPDLAVFTLLRVAQGLCMSTAFALTLAYLGEHTSAAEHRECLRRLHHRQCRLQPGRPPGGRGLSRSLRAGYELLGVRLPQSFGCGAGLVQRRADAADAPGRHEPQLAADELAHPSRQSRPARRLSHGLRDPVRLHRHLHLRQLRAESALPSRSA